jgi:hypothetical protein
MLAAHVSTVSRPSDRRVLLTSVATSSTTGMRLIKTLLTATATVMSRPRVSPRILSRDVSLDGRSPNSEMRGPPPAKRFKMVKSSRKKCTLPPRPISHGPPACFPLIRAAVQADAAQHMASKRETNASAAAEGRAVIGCDAKQLAGGELSTAAAQKVPLNFISAILPF